MKVQLPELKQQRKSGFRAFNMTPVIDIVFLLIIFFVVVSKFIEAENFPVSVPVGCDAAVQDNEPGVQLTTISVMRDEAGVVTYAVGAQEVTGEGEDLVDRLSAMMESRLSELGDGDRIVSIRVDKDVEYSSAQYALAAVAQSSATDVQLAVLPDEQQGR